MSKLYTVTFTESEFFTLKDLVQTRAKHLENRDHLGKLTTLEIVETQKLAGVFNTIRASETKGQSENG